MGLILTGFPDISPEDRARKDREVRKRLHGYKMELLGGIEKHVNEVRTDCLPKTDIRVQVVENMTPHQKVRLLKKLEEEMKSCSEYPREQSWVEQAVKEFKRGNYSYETIYDYISAKDIAKIVSN
ncbi:hypothetical protein J4433_03245 [Candidatus Pacearchaeota archaeon]|nr:hypothetical protein [Candidatus Pacearchaeota archaeon]